MISRKTAKTIADIYDYTFSYTENVRTIYGTNNPCYRLNNDKLYDYLYERNYEPWFMNLIKNIQGFKRDLKELIMKLHTTESIIAITNGWSREDREKLGQRYLENLAEDVLKFYQDESRYPLAPKEKVKDLVSSLEIDGYIFRDNKLLYSEATVLDTEEEEGIIENLVKTIDLNNKELIKHHIALSEEHYRNEKWDDSISNSRKYFEAILMEIAAKHYKAKYKEDIPEAIYKKPVEVREYLLKEGILEKKEKEAISSFYHLLSETGSHPYMAQKDQSRLMRHLSLTFSQFALLRLRGYLQSEK